MVRQWHGKLHEVIVLEGGFMYGGEKFRSLSEIARVITGTRWSGPAFFGLKKRKSEGRHSQKHEGWIAHTSKYDDGGFSGGNMDRPALKKLMVDIAAGPRRQEFPGR